MFSGEEPWWERDVVGSVMEAVRGEKLDIYIKKMVSANLQFHRKLVVQGYVGPKCYVLGTK